MEKFIETYDDIVPTDYQDYLYNLITGQIPNKPFPLYYTSNFSEGKLNDIGFNNTFHNNPQYKEYILKLLYNFSQIKGFTVSKVFLQRVFLQTPSKISYVPEPHTDAHFPHWVCLYYVNDADGDTIFYNDIGDEIKRITPKKGRIAFFDGTIKHSAGIPTINKRIVINIGFEGKI